MRVLSVEFCQTLSVLIDMIMSFFFLDYEYDYVIDRFSNIEPASFPEINLTWS